MTEYELVRVSREMVERLVADDSDPAVIASIDRHDDGTCDLSFRITDVMAEVKRLRQALIRIRDYDRRDLSVNWTIEVERIAADALASTERTEGTP